MMVYYTFILPILCVRKFYFLFIYIYFEESGEEVKSQESCCLAEEEEDPEKIRQSENHQIMPNNEWFLLIANGLLFIIRR